MKETSESNNETGTCIGCRLPWNGVSGPGCCRNAVLVIANDAGIEVTEILLPVNKGEQKNPAEKESPRGQSARAEQKTPLINRQMGDKYFQQNRRSRQNNRTEKKQEVAEEPEIPVEQSTPLGQIASAELKIAAEPAIPPGPEIIIGVRV